jgi:hypothetical protein
MPTVAPVLPSCLAQLHTEMVCHVVRRHQASAATAAAATMPLQLGDGTLAAPSGSDGAFPQLLQLGRSVGLRVAERFFFLGDDLPRSRDPDAAVSALERFWRQAELGSAQFDTRPTQKDGDTTLTQLTIVDCTFLFTRHLDLGSAGSRDHQRHVLHAPEPTDLSADAEHVEASAQESSAVSKPTADDYLSYTQGMMCGFLETLGFVAVQAGSIHRRAALASGKPVVEVSAEINPARRAAVFQVLFTVPQK